MCSEQDLELHAVLDAAVHTINDAEVDMDQEHSFTLLEEIEGTLFLETIHN